jgi:hypothetical protein
MNGHSIENIGTVNSEKINIKTISSSEWVVDTYFGGDNNPRLRFKNENNGNSYDLVDNGFGVVSSNFTGQHNYPLINKKILDGMIVSIVPKSLNKKTINIIQSLPNSEITTKSYDKKVAGVYSSINQEFSPLKTSNELNEKINSLGEGAIWVCNINGNLEIGDYIVSSNIPGIGMKQDDDLLHNYSVAKASIDCDFNPIEIENKEAIFDSSSSTYEYDTSDNLVFENKGLELEYESYELEVLNDRYIIWQDKEQTIKKFEYLFNFEQSANYIELIGNIYKIAFIGCSYHCN